MTSRPTSRTPAVNMTLPGARGDVLHSVFGRAASQRRARHKHHGVGCGLSVAGPRLGRAGIIRSATGCRRSGPTSWAPNLGARWTSSTSVFQQLRGATAHRECVAPCRLRGASGCRRGLERAVASPWHLVECRFEPLRGQTLEDNIGAFQFAKLLPRGVLDPPPRGGGGSLFPATAWVSDARLAGAAPLSYGGLVKRIVTGDIFAPLGHAKWAALCWPVRAAEVLVRSLLRPRGVRGSVNFHCSCWDMTAGFAAGERTGQWSFAWKAQSHGYVSTRLVLQFQFCLAAQGAS